MDVKELLKRKRKLEDDISEFIRKSLQDFKDETGISVKDVDITFYETRTFGSDEQELTIVSATAKLNI